MEKRPFVTQEQLQRITAEYPTPFHLYDEAGMRKNARALFDAFSWNPGFREYFAVKATPNPAILKILREEGCGVDCSSLTELMLAENAGFSGEEIMFSSNVTPAEEYRYAMKLNALINLDDITHIAFLEQCARSMGGNLPETVCCRYNPGGEFTISNQIMDNPGEAKFGFMPEQIIEGFRLLKSKGVKRFGIHAFLASNTLTDEYYPVLARSLFEMAVKIKEQVGIELSFINLSGGIGVPYTALRVNRPI